MHTTEIGVVVSCLMLLGVADEAEVVLGVVVALLGEREKFLQGRGVVAPLIGSHAFVEASPCRTDEHDEKNSRYREAFHSVIFREGDHSAIPLVRRVGG